MKTIQALFLLTVLMLAGNSGSAGAALPAPEASWSMSAVASTYKTSGWRVVEVRRIWAVDGWPQGDPDSRHNAFTDLIRFKGYWYCVFRVAPDHGQRGRLRLIRSTDGREWESVFYYAPAVAGTDVRDSKLSVTPAGKLMISGSERYVHEPARSKFEAQGLTRGTMTWLSSDGLKWEGPMFSAEAANTWIWSAPAWKDGTGYGVAYTGTHPGGAVYTTKDGTGWQLSVDDIFPAGNSRGNESSLLFDPEGTAWMLLRDGPGGKSHLGRSLAPYSSWQWKAIGPTLGGPKLVRLSNGRLIAGGRVDGSVPGYHDSCMGLLEINAEAGSMQRILTLPSQGDNAYPGIVEQDGELWVSYYSTHEDPNPEGRDSWSQRACIYLARVKTGGTAYTFPR